MDYDVANQTSRTYWSSRKNQTPSWCYTSYGTIQRYTSTIPYKSFLLLLVLYQIRCFSTVAARPLFLHLHHRVQLTCGLPRQALTLYYHQYCSIIKQFQTNNPYSCTRNRSKESKFSTMPGIWWKINSALRFGCSYIWPPPARSGWWTDARTCETLTATLMHAKLCVVLRHRRDLMLHFAWCRGAFTSSEHQHWWSVWQISLFPAVYSGVIKCRMDCYLGVYSSAEQTVMRRKYDRESVEVLHYCEDLEASSMWLLWDLHEWDFYYRTGLSRWSLIEDPLNFHNYPRELEIFMGRLPSNDCGTWHRNLRRGFG